MSARLLTIVACVLLLVGCAARGPAPVVDRMPPQPAAPPPVVATPPPVEQPPPKPIPTHTVKRGDTLVSIALQYGLDYRELAAWNNITNLNVLSVGQVLVLAPPTGAQPPAPMAGTPGGPVATPLLGPGPPIEARPLANTATAKVEPRGQKVPFSERALGQLSQPEPGAPPVVIPPPGTPPGGALPPTGTPPTAMPPEPERTTGTDSEDVNWMWPVKGRLIAPFNEAAKGIDIGGRKGTPVLAAAGGRVVYAGTGLRGYGKLVIIKHNDTWLSAYAHNDNILVKEQQDVRKGEPVALMGATDADKLKLRGKDDAVLHFEVRRQGKPVDPAKILPAP